MRLTNRSVLLLILLLIIAIFFFGLNTGKYIEKLDKRYVAARPTPRLRATPTQTPTITTIPSKIGYSRFAFSGCEVSFVVPSNFTQTTTASTEAEFQSPTSDRIFATCDQNLIQDPSETNSASASATIADQKVQIIQKNGNTSWVLKNNKTQILFEVSPIVSDLIQSTLQID